MAMFLRSERKAMAADECGRRRARLWSAGMDARPALIEFPADDPERALRFWGGLLGVELTQRSGDEGAGWRTRAEAEVAVAVGVHERGRGPGDSFSLPYFAVAEMAGALERVRALGGEVIHPGERWAICRDSEGSPFALEAPPDGAPAPG